MTIFRSIAREERGVATIEMAFALPVLIIMIWMFVQLAQVYRAMAGIQQALGEGARYATLCLNPSTSGCTAPPPVTDLGSTKSIKNKIIDTVYGIGPGTFTIDDPVLSTSKLYYDLKVNYTQPTTLLLLPGPTVVVSRSKRVWVAAT